MKTPTPQPATEVVPALGQRRAVTTPEPAASQRSTARVSRTRRFPLEQALAREPERTRPGRFIDVEV